MNNKENLARKENPEKDPKKVRKGLVVPPVKQSKVDLTKPYDEAFFQRFEKAVPGVGSEIKKETTKLNELITEALSGHYPAAKEQESEQYFGRSTVMHPQEGEAAALGSPLEISKLLLTADFVKNDQHLAVSDPRIVKLIDKKDGDIPLNMIVNFSNNEFEKLTNAGAGAMYVDNDRADLLIIRSSTSAMSQNSSMPAYIYNEKLLREALLLLRRNDKPEHIKKILESSSDLKGKHFRMGIARVDFKNDELESRTDLESGRLFVIRDNVAIDCSNSLEGESFKGFSFGKGKLKLKKKDLIMMATRELIDVLVEMAGEDVLDKSASEDRIVANELLEMASVSKDQDGNIDFDHFVEKILDNVNNYLVIKRRRGLTPSAVVLVEVPGR